jgi:hypothetical protein
VYDNGRRVPRANDDQVEALVNGDLVRPRKDALDVWALGAVLHFCRNNPYSVLWGFLDVDEVVAAFLRDMERSAPFLTLPDTSGKGRKWLMEKIAAVAPESSSELFALMVLAANADELDFLEAASPGTLLLCFEHLASREALASEASLAKNKRERVAHILSERFVDRDVDRFIGVFLALSRPHESPLGLAILGVIAERESAETWVGRAIALPTPILRKLLAVLPYATSVPWGKELLLAHALVDHVSTAVSDWARSRIPRAGRAARPRAKDEVELLSGELERAIVDASEADLADALSPCLAAPHRGLTDALARRPMPTRPHVAALVALLGSHDEPRRIAEELERHGGGDDRVMASAAREAVATWCGSEGLAPIGDAFLYRFEPHTFRLSAAMRGHPLGVAGSLGELSRLPCRHVGRMAFAAVARFVSIYRWRDKPLLETMVDEALLDLASLHLDTDVGRHAAQILMAFYDARLALPELGARRAHIAERIADFDDETRRVLDRWISSRGLPSPTGPRNVVRPPTDSELLMRIRTSSDRSELEAHCRADHPEIVHEATLRLIELGDEGVSCLVSLLLEEPRPIEWAAITDSIALWPPSAHLASLREAAERGAPEVRFRIALGLLERGEGDQRDNLVAAALTSTDTPWFRIADWVRAQRATDPRELSRALSASPHPHAYRPSVELLLDLETLVDADRAALRAFLSEGTERIGDLRRRAALTRLSDGDPIGYPIVVSELFRGEEVNVAALVSAAPELLFTVALAALFAGSKIADEKKVLPLLDHELTPLEIRDELLELLLTEAQNDGLRQAVVSRLARRPSRSRKLSAIAKTFAWGVRVGRELTGRVFRFHMIGGRGLGYTRLNDNRIHVSPLPLLRGDRHGREIVEALVLHEIGHHIYHRGEEEATVWGEAQKEGIHGLLNLVADEHLERNLRAMDAEYGNRLKRLIAYAFAHSARDLPASYLFDMLQSRAFAVLTRIRLGVARDPASVRIDNGSLLNEMEHAGLRFAKFVRALRMGLGRRHGDPLVDEALEMFDKAFRRGDMRSLLAIAYRLRDMFGAEVSIMECFGGYEAIGEDGSDRIIHGEGIEDHEVQREIERVLNPRKREGPGIDVPGGKLILNVNPDEHFDLITVVETVPYDPIRHREVGRTVARHARHMRKYLHDLGLSVVKRRMRVRGRRFDPTRTTAVVTRNDPRMLISRETQVTSDLFLGVIVDCSGSMHGEMMERARAFGVLIADAAAGLAGIDVRIFGFTDRLIYDAGDARRPAVASLDAGGGNNDAAALHHVARVARASPRRAKLLVMISDGLPTECSVAALKALVVRLTRREGICCAQVAVRPLAEKCFPHYVEVLEDDLDIAVRRFGNIVAGLVKKAMAA